MGINKITETTVDAIESYFIFRNKDVPDAAIKKVEYFYDGYSKIIWSPSDIRALVTIGELIGRKKLYIKLKNLLVNLLKLNSHLGHVISVEGTHAGIVMLPTAGGDGIAIIDRDRREVWKIYSANIVNNFTQEYYIENEVKHLEKLKEGGFGDIVPEVVSHGRLGNDKFHYLLTRYIRNNLPIEKREWPEFLIKVLHPRMLEIYAYCGIHEICPEEYYSRLKANAVSQGVYRKHIRLFDYVEKKLNNNSITVFCSTTVHGDLTRQNIHRTKEGYKILDWGHSKRSGILYDVFIQSYYKPSQQYWSSLLKKSIIPDELSLGWTKLFLRDLKKRLGITITPSECAFYYVCGLIERALEGSQESYIDPIRRVVSHGYDL